MARPLKEDKCKLCGSPFIADLFSGELSCSACSRKDVRLNTFWDDVETSGSSEVARVQKLHTDQKVHITEER